MKRIYGTPIWRYIVPAVLLVMMIGYFAIAIGFPRDARMMPLLVGATLLILLPIDLISLAHSRIGDMLRRRVNPAAGEPIKDIGGRGKQLTAIAWILAFAAAIFLVGIMLAVPLYITGSVRFLGGKKWSAAVLAGALAGIGNVALFQLLLGVDLYPGIFFAR